MSIKSGDKDTEMTDVFLKEKKNRYLVHNVRYMRAIVMGLSDHMMVQV